MVRLEHYIHYGILHGVHHWILRSQILSSSSLRMQIQNFLSGFAKTPSGDCSEGIESKRLELNEDAVIF